MSFKIITISREFGSGGRFIGEQIAQKCGIEFYDKKIIEHVAKELGISEQIVANQGEYAPAGSIFSYAFVGRDITGVSLSDQIFNIQQKLIKDIAQKEPCVIVGRCADYILSDRDDVLNVFIHGDMPEKVQRICRLYHVTEAEAVKMMADIDKRRMTNYRFYTEQKWGMAGNYTLSMNSSRLGYEMCEKMIMDCTKAGVAHSCICTSQVL